MEDPGLNIIPSKFIFDFNQEDEEFQKEEVRDRKYMLEYLVLACSFDCSDECFGSHAGQELRRKPFRLRNGCWNYIPQQCISTNCEFGPKCMFAHIPSECLYHPMVYKTMPCPYPLKSGLCSKNGSKCPMAHSEPRQASPYSLDGQHEMHNQGTLIAQVEANRINMENYSTYKIVEKNHYLAYERAPKAEVFDVNNFKTRKCDKKMAHNEKICLYFHPNALDRRRKHKFVPMPCENVFDRTLNAFQNKDCPNGDACRSAHTQNEIAYHLENYRKTVCTSRPCEMGDCCAFLHVGANISLKELESELSNVKNSYEQLVRNVEASKKQMERLKNFVCIFCKKEASEVLFCGHLYCGTCELHKCCGVLKRPFKFLFKSN